MEQNQAAHSQELSSAEQLNTQPEGEVQASGATEAAAPAEGEFQKGWRFWVVFAAVCFTTLLAAIENTVTSTALPFIVHELNAGDLYVWFVNAYFLTRYRLSQTRMRKVG